MWFALIFVLTVTMLCQSASLASNFTFLASIFHRGKQMTTLSLASFVYLFLYDALVV